MASLVVLYKTPKDAAAFDKYYAETHIPIAKKIPDSGVMRSAAALWLRRQDPPAFISSRF